MNKKVGIIIIIVCIIITFILIFLYNHKKGNFEEVINENNIVNAHNNTLKNNSQTKNVLLEIDEDTISSSHLMLIITDNNDTPYSWGEQFFVQKNVNGKWEDLKYISDNIAWITIIYSPDDNNKIYQTLNIEEYYGKLSNGKYRIKKLVYDKNLGDIDFFSNEFIIQ